MISSKDLYIILRDFYQLLEEIWSSSGCKVFIVAVLGLASPTFRHTANNWISVSSKCWWYCNVITKHVRWNGQAVIWRSKAQGMCNFAMLWSRNCAEVFERYLRERSRAFAIRQNSGKITKSYRLLWWEYILYIDVHTFTITGPKKKYQSVCCAKLKGLITCKHIISFHSNNFFHKVLRLLEVSGESKTCLHRYFSCIAWKSWWKNIWKSKKFFSFFWYW